MADAVIVMALATRNAASEKEEVDKMEKPPLALKLWTNGGAFN
jgi:hypothetical protein